MRNPRQPITCLIAIASALVGSAAQATNGFLPIGHGVIGSGLGGAGIANPSELMSVADNPALQAELGDYWGINGHLFKPELAADLGAGYSASDDSISLTPQGGISRKVDDSFNVALTLAVLGGTGSDYPATLVGDRAGIEAQGMTLSPSLSYSLSPNHHLGVALQLAYQELETDGFPGGFGSHKDSATGYGFRLGYYGEFNDQFALGLIYQSQIDLAEMDKHCRGDGVFTPYKLAGGDCSLDMPELFGLGVRYRFTDSTKLVADYQRIKWSGVDLVQDVFGWKDRSVYKVGVEHSLNSHLSLRLGFNYSKSPVAANYVAANVFAGAVSEKHYAAGLSYRFGQGQTLSGYYVYVPSHEVRQEGPVTAPGLSPLTRVKMRQQVLGISWDAPF